MARRPSVSISIVPFSEYGMSAFHAFVTPCVYVGYVSNRWAVGAGHYFAWLTRYCSVQLPEVLGALNQLSLSVSVFSI